MPLVLSEEEVERIMQQPDIGTPYGLRVRRILETFYGTGIRRTELCRLRINDIAVDRCTLFVKEGKGGKDRLPIGPCGTLYQAVPERCTPGIVTGRE